MLCDRTKKVIIMDKMITVDKHSFMVEYPEKCPLCHHYGDIAIANGHIRPSNQGVEVLFQCPFQSCKRYFIGYYGVPGQKQLLGLQPQRPELLEFSDTIKTISKDFLLIYEQAESALHAGLDQIAGPGFRKAFEFLIKDYAKHTAPPIASEIEKAFSGQVVSQYIGDPRIQAVATRALWLGNDESHYLRKWADHDISDLKTLISLTVHWIEIERLSEKYEKEMKE